MANIPYPLDCKVRVNKKPNKENRIFSLIYSDTFSKNTPVYRYIFEQRIGTQLDRNCEVDHIDGNPLNNDPMNLHVLSGVENNLKKYMNKEGMYSKGSIVLGLRCPCCGKVFEKYKYIVDRNIREGNSLFMCSRTCNARYNTSKRYNNELYKSFEIKRFEQQEVYRYTGFPEILKYVKIVGPEKFIELALMCNNVPIPIFDGITDLTRESDEWKMSIYLVYRNQLMSGLNCGENPYTICKLFSFVKSVEDMYINELQNLVYIKNYYNNDFRYILDPDVRMFNGKFVDRFTRMNVNLKPGLSSFDVGANVISDANKTQYAYLQTDTGCTPFDV